MCKKGAATSLVINTPKERGYSFEVDEEGNVVEHIRGNYIRLVEGSVEEQTLGSIVEASEGPHIMRSEAHTIITAPEVHFNPEEFKDGGEE